LRTGFVYLITNKLNGKKYVGKTLRTVDYRWAQHKTTAFNGNSMFPIHAAIRKYGTDAFSVEVLESGLPEPQLSKREMELIDEHRSHIKFQMGYNKAAAGELHPMFGRNHSDETKQAWSETRVGEGNSFFGKNHTEQALSKMRGPRPSARRPKSVEHRRAISEATMGRTVPLSARQAMAKLITIGERFEDTKWTPIGPPRYENKYKKTQRVACVPVRCDCGTEIVTTWYELKSKRTMQCRTCSNTQKALAQSKRT
jgi:group I intron endonuclease